MHSADANINSMAILPSSSCRAVILVLDVVVIGDAGVEVARHHGCAWHIHVFCGTRCGPSNARQGSAVTAGMELDRLTQLAILKWISDFHLSPYPVIFNRI